VLGRAVLLGAVLLVLLSTATAVAQEGVPVEVPASPPPPSDGIATEGGPDPSVPSVPDVPDVPGVPGVPSVPDVPDGGDDAPRVETPPVAKDDGLVYRVPGGLPLLIVLVVSVGVISSYTPGGVRRMRIEAAWRVSNKGRLALAMGDFATALAAFDLAIDEAHAAYTRRDGTGGGGRAIEWTLTPDAFYIGLWKGRAAALRGMGRHRAAEFTDVLASELEGAVGAPA
jgi:hypothetical protein